MSLVSFGTPEDISAVAILLDVPLTSVTFLYLETRQTHLLSLGHPWGTLAPVGIPRWSPSSQKSRYFEDSETQKTPQILGDSRKTHS